MLNSLAFRFLGPGQLRAARAAQRLSGVCVGFLVSVILACPNWAQVTNAPLANNPAPAEENKLPPEPAGMHEIFNGADLNGWNGDPRLWSIREGAIRGETTAENPAAGNTFLIWQGGEVSDFDLRLEFRCNATNNSGIQYRSRHITDGQPSNAWVVRGYQHEIRNELKFPNVASFFYDEGGTRGRICQTGERVTWTADGKQVAPDSLITPEEFAKLFRLDDWNEVAIIARGPRLQHYLNGRLVAELIDEDPASARGSGVLALQLHAGAPMWVEYRRLRLAPLEKPQP